KKLMHTSEDFTLDQIQKNLRIKDETRIREKNLNGASSSKELHMASMTTTDDWWYDSGTTTHVCNNRDLFKTYKKTEDGHEVMMGDNHTSKEANTPYESSCKLVENNERAVAQIEYASAIGYLMYATHCTRPDIAYVVCKLSIYTSNPSQDHWKEIGRFFGYLKRIRQLALYYDRFPEGYLDASWITGNSDSKSTTGWIFTLGGGAICWGSKKQTCITHSTMEAEFLALIAAGKKAEWLRNMLLDIELWPQPMPATSLHCDSQSTLSRAYNKVYNGKSRHISLIHSYIKELISNGIITIEYIRSCKNLADPFIKGLSKDIVFETTKEMGLKPIE
nr:zinc finger, CCHC-type [Tanacetum cinerariifolium]